MALYAAYPMAAGRGWLAMAREEKLRMPAGRQAWETPVDIDAADRADLGATCYSLCVDSRMLVSVFAIP